MVRKAVVDITDEALSENLEKYRRMAIELGAFDARVIPADMVMVENRVRAKCYFPKCGSFGTNAHCPPYVMDLEQFRKVVADYRYAVFFKLEVPPEEVVGNRVTVLQPSGTTVTVSPEEVGDGEVMSRQSNRRSQAKVHEIASKIESTAFYDGYYLSLGFGAGACKRLLCPNEECSALIPGKGCRHSLRSRPSMEAMGMNVFAMAKKVGWDAYPLGRGMKSTEGVPYASRFGIVLIC